MPQDRQAATSSRSFSTGRSVVALLLLACVLTLLAANRNIALLHIPATMTSPIILENARGTRVEILPLGAIIQRLWVADRDGKLEDVVLGFDTETPYKVAHDLGGDVGTGRSQGAWRTLVLVIFLQLGFVPCRVKGVVCHACRFSCPPKLAGWVVALLRGRGRPGGQPHRQWDL